MLPPGEWFSEPSSRDYVYAEVCRKSGQLKGQFCTESDSLAVPPAALRSKACPYHKPVLLTSDGSHRLQGPAPGCVTGNFFILPPAMEWYYRRTHSDYVPLPPLLPGSLSSGNFIPMAFIYPEQGSSIFIPKSLTAVTAKLFSVLPTAIRRQMFIGILILNTSAAPDLFIVFRSVLRAAATV